MINNEHSEQGITDAILKNVRLRKAIAYRSHLLFFHIYFPHYIQFAIADFQRELFAITEDLTLKTIILTAFRGSAKSTIMNMSLVLWSIFGKPECKFIVIVAQTQEQARQHMHNIKRELETNPLLRRDMGPFQEIEDEWRNKSIILSQYNVKIIAVSIDQSVRGLRHGPHRPDLIICDDIEDLSSVKTREGRDKTYQWLKSELIPAGDTNTRLVIIGNLLHEDCILRRLQREIEVGDTTQTYREYPLLHDEGICLWPAKFPTEESIEGARRRIGNEEAWQREFLLRIISTTERVVHPEWILRYENIPHGIERCFLYTVTAIDLAISQKESADFTAMVSARVYRINGKIHIYILPNPINQRLTALDTVRVAKEVVGTLSSNGHRYKILVEDVAYQAAMVELLRNEGLHAKSVRVGGSDKRSRLATAANLVQSGQVLFPAYGAEELITQLTGFGKERHDDLADAFSMLVLRVIHDERNFGQVRTFPFNSIT